MKDVDINSFSAGFKNRLTLSGGCGKRLTNCVASIGIP